MPTAQMKANMFHVFTRAMQDLRSAGSDCQRFEALNEIWPLAAYCGWPLLRERARRVVDAHVDQFPDLAYPPDAHLL